MGQLMTLLQGIAGGGGGGGAPNMTSMPLQCMLEAMGVDPQMLLALPGARERNVTQNVQLGILFDDVAIIASDLWAAEPKILSALPGFDGIVGLNNDMDSALQGGATFVTDEQREGLCGKNFDAPVTSAVAFTVGNIYNCESRLDADDGFPICFSWPVLLSSIDRMHLLYKRSDGIEFHPKCISAIPNFEYNERHCIVIFDDFFNRKLPDEEGYIYMTELEIVGPLQLVGPDGPVSIQGMTWTNNRNQSAYLSGPVFVGARLVPLHDDGESLPSAYYTLFGGDDTFPNQGSVVYASEELPAYELFRLRTYYSGGMTPDGLTGLNPTMFDRYFALDFSTGQHLATSNSPMTINGTNTTMTVLGLADVGIYLEEGYTPCYTDDRDNYIDIILHVVGDPTVLESTLTSFTAFSQQPGLYNPGGPGPFPFDSVRYVAPAPVQTFPIDVDLGRVREVTYCIHSNGTVATDVATCQSWLDSREMMQVEQGQVFANQINSLLAALQGSLDTEAPVETESPAASKGSDIISRSSHDRSIYPFHPILWTVLSMSIW